MTIEFEQLPVQLTDSQQALAEMEVFLQSEINRIVGELSDPKRHISPDRITEIKEQLENPTTVEIPQPEFTVHRRGNNGFRLDWHDHQMAA